MADKKILMIEDSPTIRFEVKLIMDKIGVQMIEASNQFGMINALDQFDNQIGLIIMDLVLKEENGFDLIRYLKDEERYREIPVLVLTEHSSRDDVLKAKDLGVEGYLRKPIQKDDLVQRVKKYIG